jgi:hypothetical protein
MVLMGFLRSCVLASFWIPFGFSFLSENMDGGFYFALALLIMVLVLISVAVSVRVNFGREVERTEDFEGILWI